MGQSPAQLLSHAYLSLNIKSVVYVSDVISFIVENEQNDMVSELNDQITKNLENFINNILNKKIQDLQKMMEHNHEKQLQRKSSMDNRSSGCCRIGCYWL